MDSDFNIKKIFYTAKIDRSKYKLSIILTLIGFAFISTFIFSALSAQFSTFKLLSPVAPDTLKSLNDKEVKNQYEVFGFAPHWTLHKLDNVDFSVLTTLAYFGIEVDGNGYMDTNSPGYEKFNSSQATELFKRAHDNGTRVVLTLTQMNNASIRSLINSEESQERLINDSVSMVSSRGIDGINVDFEYVGNPGDTYRNKFSQFVKKLTREMHAKIPASKVTVSVYASSIKDPKIYDISTLGNDSDGIFMMAYDFATAGSDTVIPTAPLRGHKEGKYWYDIATAVDDFLLHMPKEKLILGLPWYGYNYPVAKPGFKASKNSGYYSYYWRRGYKYRYFVARPAAHAQTYTLVQNDIAPVQEGWDEYGQVGWKAYQGSDGWRMIFLDDERSLAIKYDFAKEKQLGGVGMWALGFDSGKTELWTLLSNKFGKKLVDNRIKKRTIYEKI